MLKLTWKSDKKINPKKGEIYFIYSIFTQCLLWSILNVSFNEIFNQKEVFIMYGKIIEASCH